MKEIPSDKFHHVWEGAKAKAGAQEDNDLSTEDLKEVFSLLGENVSDDEVNSKY